MQSCTFELSAGIERVQAGPARQETEQPPRARSLRIYRDCHDTATGPQHARSRLQHSRSLFTTQHVEQITHEDYVEARVGKWQVSRIGQHELPRTRQTASAREHRTRPIDPNHMRRLHASAGQLVEECASASGNIENPFGRLHIR